MTLSCGRAVLVVLAALALVAANSLPVLAQSATCGAQYPGLKAFWPADGNALDAAGTNHGRLVGGVSYGIGLAGSAFVFDGATGYVAIPDAPGLNPQAITVEAWIRPEQQSPGHYPPILKKNGTHDNAGYALELTYDGRAVVFGVLARGGGWVLTANYPVTMDQWTHVAGTYDGQYVRLFLNGVAVSERYAPGSIVPADGELHIGHDPTLVSRYFKGAIDEAGVHDRALAPAEVFAIYAAGAAGRCPLGDGLFVPLTQAPYGFPVELSALLRTAGTPAFGHTVHFSIFGLDAGAATTDATGLAGVTVPAGGWDVGYYPAAVSATVGGSGSVPATTVTGALEIVRATPMLTWAPVAPVDADGVVQWTGPLTEAVLNATASVAGSFDYGGLMVGVSPWPGSGSICATFTPTDAAHYSTTRVCRQFYFTFAFSTARSAPRLGVTLNGGAWGAPAVDLVRNRVYVPNGETGNVDILDGTTHAVIGALTMSGECAGAEWGVDVDQGTNRVYVACSGSPDLWIFNGATASVTQRIPIPGNYTYSVWVNPSTGLAYVFGGDYGTGDDRYFLFEVSPARPADDPRHVMTLAELEHWGDQIAIDPVSNYVYVSMAPIGGLPLLVFDGNPARPAGVNPLIATVACPEPYSYWEGGLSLNRRTKELYASFNDHGIGVIDVDTQPSHAGSFLRVVREVVIDQRLQPTATSGIMWPSGIAVNPTTGVLYAKLADIEYTGVSTLTAFDAASGETLSITSLPDWAHRYSTGLVVVNPATGNVYVTNQTAWQTAFTVLTDRAPSTAAIEAGTTVAATTVPATVVFPVVTAAGTTTVTPIDPMDVPIQDAGQFKVDEAIAYEVSTTAVFWTTTGELVAVCFNVGSVTSPEAFANLRLWHGENGSWVDVTTTRDFDTGTICGQVTSFSPFAIAPTLVPALPGAAQIDSLVAAVRGANPPLGPGLAADLTTKLVEASRFLAAGRRADALAKLTAFETALRRGLTQKPGKATAAQSVALLAALNRIRTALQQ